MKKMAVRFNRGLSPIIATVLLIMLVLILAALIFLWAKGLISEQIEKNGQAIENVCPLVVFDVNLISNLSGSFLESINRGSVSIYSFDLKLIGKGESVISKIPSGVNVGESLVEDISDKMTMKNGDAPEKITIYPVLVGKIKGGKLTKPYTCIDIGKTITI